MTPDELTRLRELHETASPAPWEFDVVDGRLLHGEKEIGAECYGGIETREDEANFWLITEARNALPALLAEIERLQARERILAARLARVNEIVPATYLLALNAREGATTSIIQYPSAQGKEAGND